MRFYIAAIVFVFLSSTAGATPAEDAFKLCKMIDGTGLTSSPCEVSGWGSSVTATIDMSASEARDLCSKMSGFTAAQGWKLSGWMLNIRSPYSGDRNIAYCTLR